MSQFNRVGLVGRLGNAKVIETLRHLIRFLQTKNIEILLEEKNADSLPGHGLKVVPIDEMGNHADLLIVVGGDGSLLSASRALCASQIPVVGVNRGKLGFLTDIRPQNIEAEVSQVLEGAYTQEQRFLLEVQLWREDALIEQGVALNDIVLHPGKIARMIQFELYIDEQFVYNQVSDGLIVSTPTGSTAYALSAGGPIMHPKLDALVLVPMFPHTLSSRPIVVDASSELCLLISTENKNYPNLSCDGQENISCQPGDTIKVIKHKQSLQLIHPLNYNFYSTCREKLGWGSKLGAK